MSIVVPVFNEDATLQQIVNKILSQGFDHELILVDDGSTDGTAEMIASLESFPKVHVYRHGTNRGKAPP